MLVPAGSPIFFLREYRLALASRLLSSVFIDIVYAAIIIVDEVFIIYFYSYIHSSLILDAQFYIAFLCRI